MKKMIFKLKGAIPKNTQMTVDGKYVKSKKDKFGNYVISYQTEKDKVGVRVFKFLELDTKAWFWLEMLYFFLTVFGLFDVRLDKRCLVVDALFEFDVVDGAEIVLKINKFEPNGKAVLVETGSEKKNIQYVDNEAKKKLKKLRIAKILSVVFIAIIVIGLIILF